MPDSTPTRQSKLEARFWAKVNKTDTCWLWTAALNARRYGMFKVGDRVVGAHRVAYELCVGPIPDDLQLDHVCHSRDGSCAGGDACLHRRCVNPDHLEPVTARVNTLRGMSPAADASRRTHCPKGHPYDAENTFFVKRGFRKCRACNHIREVAKWAKAKRRREEAANAPTP